MRNIGIILQGTYTWLKLICGAAHAVDHNDSSCFTWGYLWRWTSSAFSKWSFWTIFKGKTAIMHCNCHWPVFSMQSHKHSLSIWEPLYIDLFKRFDFILLGSINLVFVSVTWLWQRYSCIFTVVYDLGIKNKCESSSKRKQSRDSTNLDL